MKKEYKDADLVIGILDSIFGPLGDPNMIYTEQVEFISKVEIIYSILREKDVISEDDDYERMILFYQLYNACYDEKVPLCCKGVLHQLSLQQQWVEVNSYTRSYA